MRPVAAAATAADVRELIGGLLAEGSRARSAPPAEWSASFAEQGLQADDVVDLLVRIEDALAVTFENRELSPTTLRSPETLEALVREKGGEAAAATRKRLAHLTSEFLPHLSGPQRTICDLHEQLGSGLESMVFTLDRARGGAERECLRGIPIARFDAPRATDLARLRERFRRIAAHPDLDAEEMANYDLSSSQLFAGLRRARPDAIVSYFWSGILAQDVIDFFPSTEWILVPFYFQPPSARTTEPCWWDVQRVDKVLLFQEQDYAAALRSGLPRRKLTLLPFPVNTRRFRPLGGRRDAETLLYVGRLTPNKGIRAFLETFRTMVAKRPSLRLRLVADLDSPSPLERHETARLRAEIDRLGLTDEVEFAGRKEDDALVEEYSRHAIHILPSRGDCYSFVTMEALACGMTCVNLDNPRYEWQRRRDGELPLVHLCPSLPEMGRRVLELLEDGALPDHRGYMAQHLSWDRYRDEYRDFFLE